MLTAAIVSTDAASSGVLLKSLQQTGLVYSVREWSPTVRNNVGPGDALPDLVLLDLVGDMEADFAFAANLRRLRPTIRIIACSSLQQPDPGMLLQAMRSGVQEFLTKPIEVGLLRETLMRFAQEKEASGVRSTERTIVVLGAKGGVGTSTVAVNLGVQLAQLSKKRVVLLDLARPVGHVSLMLDLQPRFSIRDAVENLDRLDGHFFTGLLGRHKSGLEVLAGAAHPEEWLKIAAPALERVVNVAKSTCDCVLMDAGAQYPLDWGAMLRQARSILLIAEANVPSLWTLERQFSAATALGIDPERIRIIINRWHRGDEDALKSLEKNTKRPIFMRIPNDFRQVSQAINMGVPLSGNHSNLLVSKFTQLACQLAGISPPGPGKRGGLAGLLPFHSTK